MNYMCRHSRCKHRFIRLYHFEATPNESSQPYAMCREYNTNQIQKENKLGERKRFDCEVLLNNERNYQKSPDLLPQNLHVVELLCTDSCSSINFN